MDVSSESARPASGPAPRPAPRSVLLLGATGTIGRATAAALIAAGHAVTALLRPGSAADAVPPGVRILRGSAAVPAEVAAALRAAGPDAVVSCMASRTGAPADAWAVDHDAHLTVLRAAQAAGVETFVLLSAICVQKPQLAFQHAKLAFERALQESGLTWSIVRPTAYFKSLSGQVARVQAGRSFLLFGDGTQTACKPISDADLGRYLVLCLSDPALQNKVLPIGGPGPAITPREQGAYLFDRLGRAPRFASLPLGVMDGIVGLLAAAGHVIPAAARKAEFARTGRYYARESMLLWDAEAGRYDAAATPSFGNDTLWQHYDRMLAGEATVDLGAHAVF